MSFVHLRIHTEYSLSDSVIKVSDLVSQAAEFNMPAVGVTDLHNIFSAIKVYTNCIKWGIKPIIGVEAPIKNAINPNLPYSLVLLCRNMDGYKSMCRLISDSQAKQNGSVGIDRKELIGATDGLIALSGAQDGEIGQKLIQGKFDEAKQILEEYETLFPGRFYIDVCRVGGAAEIMYGNNALELAELTNTPVVATNQPRFIRKEEFGMHELKICIHDRAILSDQQRRRNYTEQQYFRSPEEMTESFSDLTEALENTLEIAKRCNLRFDLEKSNMPAYPRPIEEGSLDDYLARLSRQGLEEKFPIGTDEIYHDRLERELQIIRDTNYAGYFLIVWDIIEWAKSEGIPVGPGRGSGAGSLVAYCLNITSVDPIEYDLIFERFLNPERVSPPDFDIDFCVEKRDRLIEHVSDRYGKDRVAQIITYSTMAARAAVKDVGRALKPDYLFYDQLAKLIPREPDVTLERALERSSEFKARYEKEPRVRDLIETAKPLEGIVRNVSKHAGGVVIAPTPITDYSALIADKDSDRDITHFDKDDLEAIGLVKFDFLGLTTLTIIARTLQNLNAKRGPDEPKITEESIPLDDKETYRNIATGRTVGVFQLESLGMQRLIVSMQPREFNDLVALLALFRPGPLQNKMDKMYIENRKSKEYRRLHKNLKEVLDATYGVILYQEQVMKIAQIMSGYTLGEADILRWAMGKKVKKEMQIQRVRFVKGAIENEYSEELATEVYDLIESFGGYGFNKSHSVAYAILAYRTAWLKTHYRAEFLAACMSVDMKVETIVKVINDARLHKITIVKPDINCSVYEFTAISDHEILYGLGAVKQIGSSVVEAVVAARQVGGHFLNISDFCMRIDLNRVSKSAVQALICAGAFDELDENRASLYVNAEIAYGMAQSIEQERSSGQLNIFGNDEENTQMPVFEEVSPWSRSERLKREFQILGLYVSEHPIKQYEIEFNALLSCRIVDIESEESRRVTICGWLSNKRVVDSKKGRRNVFLDIEDSSGTMTVSVFSELFLSCADILVENTPIIVVGRMTGDENFGKKRFVADNVFDLKTVRSDLKTQLSLKLEHDRHSIEDLMQLQHVLEQFGGGDQTIKIEYISEQGEARYSLSSEWRIALSEELASEVQGIFGADSFTVDYSNVRLSGHFSPANESVN